jgi:hypothetical protein
LSRSVLPGRRRACWSKLRGGRVARVMFSADV